MKRNPDRDSSSRLPSACRGAISIPQLLVLGVVVAVVLYGVSRMFAQDTGFLGATSRQESSEARNGEAPRTAGKEGGQQAGTVGTVRAGDPGHGIAPGLPSGSPGASQPQPSSSEPPRAANGVPVSPRGAESLLGQLSDIKQTYANAPKENDAAIRRILRQLAALGPAAIPALREFLASGEDLAFELVSVDGRLVDSETLRLAMLELLASMGSPDATGVLIDELQSTGSPQEIQAIARLLDEQYPGEYRKVAVDAALDVLGRMSRGEYPGTDAAPLFHLLGEFGDAETLARLEKSDSLWPLYRAAALAEAPDGAGVAGLIRIWQQGGDPALQQVTTQLMAQSAARYPAAAQALTEALRGNKISIPDHLWSKIGQALSGSYELGLLKPDVGARPGELPRNPYRSMSIGGGEGGSYTLYITDVANLTPEERRARLTVVERLLDQNLGPAATRALEQARNTLLR